MALLLHDSLLEFAILDVRIVGYNQMRNAHVALVGKTHQRYGDFHGAKSAVLFRRYLSLNFH
jgi:hypothetical protein